MKTPRIVLITMLALILGTPFVNAGILLPSAYADPIQNANTERIGNYQFQLTTDPKNPIQGMPTKILFRVASVDGTDLVDVPIVLRIVDSDGKLVQKTDQIVLPAGHYSYQTTFQKTGRQTIYVDLNDYAYTG